MKKLIKEYFEIESYTTGEAELKIPARLSSFCKKSIPVKDVLTFGEVVQNEMEKRKLSIRKLAHLTKIPPWYIEDILTDTHKPLQHELKRLLSVFEDVKELLLRTYRDTFFIPFEIGPPVRGKRKVPDEEALENARLIREFKKGDERAFNILYRKYNSFLENFVKNKIRGLHINQETHDIVQSIWMKIIKNISKYRERYLFKAWLIRIMDNHIKDILRKNKSSFQELHLENMEDVIEEKREDEMVWMIKLCFYRMKQEDSDILKGYYFKGYTYKELAERYNTSISSISRRIKRSMDRLKECVKKIMGDFYGE